MLARILGGRRANGIPILVSLCGFRNLTSAKAPLNQPHTLEDCLTGTLGFSRDEAAAAINKVTRAKPAQDPVLVVNFLERNGFDKNQIKTLVSAFPGVLMLNLEKNIKPKILALQEIGLSGAELVKFLMPGRNLFNRGLDTHIRPTLDYLRALSGSDKIVLRIVKSSPWLLASNYYKTLPAKVQFLADFGMAKELIAKFMIWYPRYIMQSVPRHKEVFRQLDRDFKETISRDSPMFYYIGAAVSCLSKEKLDLKFRVYRRFGFSDSDVIEMIQRQPSCLNSAEATIEKRLNFFLNELGCKRDQLIVYPRVLKYSLDKRILPRLQVLKLLTKEKLIKKDLSDLLPFHLTKSVFLKRYVLPYRDKIPDLYESYMKSIGL